MTTPGSPEPKLRILHVDEVDWGGVVPLLQLFTTSQAAQGHDVHALLTPSVPALSPDVTRHDWAVTRASPVSLARGVHQLRRTLEAVQPDVVHLHSFFAGALGRLPFGLSRTTRVPVVYEPHSWSIDRFDHVIPRQTIRVAELIGARHTDLIIAGSEDEIEHGRRLGITVPGRRLGVAVDLEWFRPPTPTERREARRELGLDDRRVVLMLGRLAHQKGQDLLLPVWERRPPPDALLAMVGPGSVEHLRGLAPTQWGRTIVAPGATDNVRPWLWASDVLLQSSRYEGMSVVVPEALASGLPVVATAVDSAREMVEEGADPAGEVVPLGNMEALLDALARRLDQPDLRAAEATAARRRAVARFDGAHVNDRLVSAYREAIRLTRTRRS